MSAISINQPVPDSLRNAEVLDSQGNGHKMANFWQEKPTLFVFVRHFGCIGCTLQINAISPRLEELELLGIRTVVIGNGDQLYIDAFKERHFLTGRPIEIYTDPSLVVYRQANLKRNFFIALGPSTWWEFLVAWSKGVSQRSVEGDNGQMGGTMLVCEEGIVRFYYRNKTVANHSDPNGIIDRLHQFVGRRNQSKL